MHRGFSVLEILIAMTLVLSAIGAVSLAMAGNATFLVGGQTNAEALHIAQGVLEEQQALARKDFRLVVATSSNTTSGAITYHTTIAVATTTVPGSTTQDYFTKRVTTIVSWAGQYGRNASLTLSTLVTNFQGAVGGDTCDPEPNGSWSVPTVTNTTLATAIGDAVAAPYPITGLDAYQKRLYVTIATSSSPVGPQNPTTGTDVASVGTLAWSTPGNIVSNNLSYATRILSGTAVSHYLRASNFGFTIPPGSTILGIKAEIDRSRTGGSTGEARDSEVKIVRADGTVGSSNKAATGTNWPTSDAYVSYGSAADSWNEQWTPADINSANFGVVLAVTGSTGSTNRTAQVDHVRITIYYTKSFYIFNAANPLSPIFIGGLATSTITNGLNAVAVATSSAGDYAYVATNSNAGVNQLQVINITDPAKPFVTATYPSVLPGSMGSGVGSGIFYRDGYVFLTLTHVGAGDEFNVIDVTDPKNPAWKGGYAIGTKADSVYVKDGYAYVSTDDSTRELMVFNIMNPAAPSLSTTYNATPDSSGWGFGRALYKVGDTIYFGRSWTNSGTTAQFLSIKAATTPYTQGVTKWLGTNLSLNGLVVRDYLAYLLTGSAVSGGQLQIINATSTATVATVPLPNGAGGVGGVSLDCEGNVLYAASVDSTNRGYVVSVTNH